MQQFAVVPDAFIASRSSSLAASTSSMSFDNIIKTSFSHFSSNTLTIPDSNALYWMHIGIDVPANTQAHLQLTGSTLSIWKTHSALNGVDTMTNDGFVQASQGTQLTLSTDFATNSSAINQPYWVGFRLDNYFSPLIAFSVILTSAYGNPNAPVPFDVVLLNLGQGWLHKEFVPPYAGIYFFRLSVGVSFSTPCQLSLRVNGQYPCSFQTGLANYVTAGDNKFDIVSRTCMIDMETTDVASVYLITRMLNNAPCIIGSTKYQQTAFSGFLYSPVSFFTRVSI